MILFVTPTVFFSFLARRFFTPGTKPYNVGKQFIIHHLLVKFLHPQGNVVSVIGSAMDQPYAITVHHQFVYWTTWKRKSILRANKYNGTDVTVIRSQVDGLRDVRVFSPQRQPPGGPCTNNGGCAELCLAVSSSRRRRVDPALYSYKLTRHSFIYFFVHSYNFSQLRYCLAFASVGNKSFCKPEQSVLKRDLDLIWSPLVNVIESLISCQRNGLFATNGK